MMTVGKERSVGQIVREHSEGFRTGCRFGVLNDGTVIDKTATGLRRGVSQHSTLEQAHKSATRYCREQCAPAMAKEGV
jgi:hypothetical protein